MRRFQVEHRTRFEYTAPISETVMELRLTPLDGGGQSLLDFTLEVSPRVKLASYRDGYGNTVHHFNLLRGHRRLTVTSRSEVEVGGEEDRRPVGAEDGDGLVWDFLRFRPPAIVWGTDEVSAPATVTFAFVTSMGTPSVIDPETSRLAPVTTGGIIGA